MNYLTVGPATFSSFVCSLSVYLFFFRLFDRSFICSFFCFSGCLVVCFPGHLYVYITCTLHFSIQCVI